MAPRLGTTFLCLLLHVCLLSSPVWTRLSVDLVPEVQVYMGDSAQISCLYNFTDMDTEPNVVMIQWFVRGLGSSRRRISYMDKALNIVDNRTDYTGRINVSREDHGVLFTVNDVQVSDEREFFCQVNGLEWGSTEGRTNLRVFAPPEAPVIEGVVTGISVTKEVPSQVASCWVRNGFPQPNISWYRDGVLLENTPGQVNILTLTWKTNDLYNVQGSLEVKVTKEDKDARFSCAVVYQVPQGVRRMETDGVNITVHYPTSAVHLWKESPEGGVKEGDSVELRCQGDGNPPPSFIFSKGLDGDLDHSGDTLILSPVSREDSGSYRCRPVGFDRDSDVSGKVELKVHYLDPAVVVPKESEFMMRGEDLTASCNALSSLTTNTIWFKDGKQVGEGNTLHLHHATFEMTGKYVCEVSVPTLPALQTRGSMHIIVQGAPQLLGLDHEVEMEEATGRKVNLSCEAQGHPSPSISWNISGTENWREVISQSDERMTRSVMSLEVSADIIAHCNASNDMGTETKTFSIRAIPKIITVAPFSPGFEGRGVIIVVIILSLLLLAVLGSVLYFLHKKGKIPCGRTGKQDITKEKTTKDDIVVEMKTNANEDTVLLKSVNGDKKDPNNKVNGNHTPQEDRAC